MKFPDLHKEVMFANPTPHRGGVGVNLQFFFFFFYLCFAVD